MRINMIDNNKKKKNRFDKKYTCISITTLW